MFVKDLYVEARNVTKVKGGTSAKETLELLRESGYRCIPVIGERGEYLGMIYKVHLLEFLYVEQGNPSAPIDGILKHQDEFILENDTFVKSLSKIKALPFIAVVKDERLVGILTHNKIMSVMEDSLGLGTGGTNFTVSAFETTGVIDRLGEALKNENIQGLFTLDNGAVLVRRIVFTIGKEKNEKEIQSIKKKIEKAGLRVLSIEKL